MKRILLVVGQVTTALQAARQIRPWLRERETSVTLMAVAGPGLLSPLSHAIKTLEQVEAVFTGAAEQPGILVRSGKDPAAEICREAEQGAYDLLAMGLRDSPSPDGRVMGATCAAVLQRCALPMFITPPDLHPRWTPQVLVVAGSAQPGRETIDWLLAQWQAQRLGVILYARSAEESRPLQAVLERARIRAQVVTGGLSPQEIAGLGRERRVRWIVLPAPAAPEQEMPPAFVGDLLGSVTCPLLLVPASL
jgi:nucleotide-binding universal stress UspA family protein